MAKDVFEKINKVQEVELIVAELEKEGKISLEQAEEYGEKLDEIIQAIYML